MVKIQYNNAEVAFKIIRDDKDLPNEILFYNPHSKQYVENVREITQGWSFDIEEDNKDLEEIIRFIEVLDWADFLMDVDNENDIFRLRFYPIESLPGADAVGIEKITNKNESEITNEFIEKYLEIKKDNELLSASDCGSFEFYYQEGLITVVDRRDERFIEYRKEDDKDDFNHTLAILERGDLIS